MVYAQVLKPKALKRGGPVRPNLIQLQLLVHAYPQPASEAPSVILTRQPT